MSNRPLLLETRDLCVAYGAVEALHKINIRIRNAAGDYRWMSVEGRPITVTTPPRIRPVRGSKLSSV